jgi:hypothetical protein
LTEILLSLRVVRKEEENGVLFTERSGTTTEEKTTILASPGMGGTSFLLLISSDTWKGWGTLEDEEFSSPWGWAHTRGV